MKKTFLIRVLVMFVFSAVFSLGINAQSQGDKAVGANFLIGSGDSYTNMGIGAKFFYNVTDPIRAAAEFDYFLKKDNVSMWDFSVYGHYLFPVAENILVYPSVGLGMVGSSASTPSISIGGVEFGGGKSNSDFAFSIGGGVDYVLTSNLSLNGEIRLKFSDGSRFNIAIGAAYKF